MQNVAALVRRYVDDGRFPGAVTVVSRREMAVRDLLMHTSGLAAPNGKHPVSLLYQEAGLTGMDSDAPLSELPGRLAGLPLQADPIRRELRAAVYASLDD